MAVVCAHVYPRFVVGAAGVDVFFAISGFVIVLSSEKLLAAPGAPIVFLRKRLIRIVPIYWLFTALALLTLGSIRPATVATSFLFIPHVNDYSGGVLPILSVGWTLNIEMFFYALFALALTVSARMGMLIFLITAVLIGLTVFSAHTGLPYAFAAYWTTPIALEFAFGMLIALAYLAGLRLSAAWAPAIVIAALAIFVTLGNGDAQPLGWQRVLVWGIPSALIVASSALANWKLGVFAPAAALIGAASYDIYLTHVFSIAYVPQSLGGDMGRVIAALVIGLGVYLAVDYPIISFLAGRAKARPISTVFEQGSDLLPALDKVVPTRASKIDVAQQRPRPLVPDPRPSASAKAQDDRITGRVR